MEFEMLQIAKDIGPFACIMMFFVWRDYKREHRLEGRVDELNSFVRTELMEALKRNSEIISRWKTEIHDVH
ncbi:MAG: hypothetical protein GY906_04650 [bacterium]|nr:hypothetical protein [bacterium]